MIWVGGEVRPVDGLAIAATDRTFEHGLGLFETLRTWGGRPVLLGRHRARMLRSAGELGLPIGPGELPDEADVARLLEAEGLPGDRVLRITATGGSGEGRSVVWMRSRPLGPPPAPAGVRVALGPWTIRPDDPLARHKSLNYWSRRIALGSAAARGFDETLGGPAAGEFTEGSYTNLFLVEGGALATPWLRAPILPGVMRGLVLELAREAGIEAEEVPRIDRDRLEAADEVFLTNSVRGILPVAHAQGDPDGGSRDWAAPGPRTRALHGRLAERLAEGVDRA